MEFLVIWVSRLAQATSIYKWIYDSFFFGRCILNIFSPIISCYSISFRCPLSNTQIMRCKSKPENEWTVASNLLCLQRYLTHDGRKLCQFISNRCVIWVFWPFMIHVQLVDLECRFSKIVKSWKWSIKLMLALSKYSKYWFIIQLLKLLKFQFYKALKSKNWSKIGSFFHGTSKHPEMDEPSVVKMCLFI